MSDITVLNLGNENEETFDKRIIVIAKSRDIFLDRESMKKRLLYMEDKYFLYETPQHKKIKIMYEDIDKLVLGMCSRFRSKGFYSQFSYFLDLDIYAGEKIHKLEVQNVKTAAEVIDFLISLPITIVDPINIVQIFREHHDSLERYRFLQSKFKKIAKKYGLDNPREGQIN